MVRRTMKKAWHLHETVNGTTHLWFKLRASCSSRAPAEFFEYRFTGTEYTRVDGNRAVTPSDGRSVASKQCKRPAGFAIEWTGSYQRRHIAPGIPRTPSRDSISTSNR